MKVSMSDLHHVKQLLTNLLHGVSSHFCTAIDKLIIGFYMCYNEILKICLFKLLDMLLTAHFYNGSNKMVTIFSIEKVEHSSLN